MLLRRCAFYVFFVLGVASDARTIDCDEYHECALGAIRERILNHSVSDKDHPIVRALLRHKHPPECDGTDSEKVAQKKKDEFPDHVSVYGPQCESRFSFTTAEGFVGHAFLLFNVSLGTLWYELYKRKNRENDKDADEKDRLLDN